MSTQTGVIVTGGAQGIGKGIARLLLDRGFQVIIADSDAEAGQEAVAEFAKPDWIHFIQTDVGEENSVSKCITQAAQFSQDIVALINNAGVGSSQNLPIEKQSLEEWNRILNTNLTGIFLMTKHTTPFLRQSKGSIVNIASTRALQSAANTEAYSASKGGIVALTHSLAVSLGPDIRVNCISPGWIEVGPWQKQVNRRVPKHSIVDKAQHPVGRVGTPEDIAELVAFLISDAAGFITGQNYVVDGGMTKKMIYVE